jgi:hypothetical protein
LKYITVHKKTRNILNANYSDVKNKKKNKFWKWIKRILFFILLVLLFLEFNHFIMAIEALRNVNADQINIINDLAHKVHDLQLSNANLQIQTDMMKVKINGLEVIHNVSQQPAIHNSVHNALNNIQSQPAPQVNIMDTISSSVHNGISDATTQVAVVTTTLIAVFGVLKSMASFIPILP